jgi:NAD(P)H-dependent FMN reductase
MNIQIIIGSVRQNRATPQVAEWVHATAQARQGEVTYNLVDLKDFDLPLFDEPRSPQGNPDRQVTGEVKRWIDTVNEADGYVVVTPEYNHSLPSALKNAIDYLDNQLMKKPVAIISHGSVGGARANEHVRLIVNSTLGGVPIPQSITLVGSVERGGVFESDGTLTEAFAGVQPRLDGLLEALEWYTGALKAARS